MSVYRKKERKKKGLGLPANLMNPTSMISVIFFFFFSK